MRMTDLLVVNKPKGMVVHPAPPATRTARWSTRCCSTVRGSCPASAGPSAPALSIALIRTPAAFWSLPKTDAAHQALSDQMSVHSIHRVYHAVVYGNLKEDKGFVEKPASAATQGSQKDGRPSRTRRGPNMPTPAGRCWNATATFTYIACKIKDRAAPIRFVYIWRPWAIRWLGMPCMAQKIVSAA